MTGGLLFIIIFWLFILTIRTDDSSELRMRIASLETELERIKKVNTGTFQMQPERTPERLRGPY